MKKVLTVTLTVFLIFSLLSVSVLASDGQEASAESNVFADVYSLILQHSDKILSALAFCASLFLAFTYRSGIVPLIKGGLNTLGATVTKLQEEADKASEASVKTLTEAKDKLTDTEKCLSSLSEKLDCVEKRLSEAIEDKKSAEDMKIILESQIDMLYDIFMSSSIPLFQKEAVGEKISAMKKRLLDTEEKSDE